MKKLLTLGMLILLVGGCVPTEFFPKVVPGKNVIFFLDFRPYVEKGFTFSTGDINQNYTPIGTINLVMTPDTILTLAPYGNYWNTAGKEIIEDGGKRFFIWKESQKNPEISQVLEEIYKTAVEFGGNGIIYFKTEYKDNNISESTGTVVKIAR